MDVIGEGDHCRVYREGELVRKVAKHKQAALALENEARLLRRLRLQTPIPRVIETGPGFMVQTYLPGTPLSTELWIGWREPQRELLRAQLWEFLEEFPDEWIHGDLSPDHILVEEETGRLTGIIDFADATPGDLAYELRFLYEDLGPEFFRHFCADDEALYITAARHSIADSLRYAREHPDSAQQIEEQIRWQRADLDGRNLTGPLFRKAGWSDIPELAWLINRSYRSTEGWTHEANLLEGDRVDDATLWELLEAPESRMELLLSDDGRLLGSVHLKFEATQAYLGMLTVDPAVQGTGHGRTLLDRAASLARAGGPRRLVLTVIEQRPELVAYYHRRGYRRTGVTYPFPTDPSVGEPLQKLHLLEMALLF
jgi:ribosomal protein S18 acetylase RimI-like enzyme